MNRCRTDTISASARKWREEDGIIRFSVISDGTTGSEWITRLESKSFRVGEYAKIILRSSDFKPAKAGVTTEIAVLKGMLFRDSDRITKKIRVEADKRNLVKPNTEVACFIREMVSDEEMEAMGLSWIITMHEPINVSIIVPHLLGVSRHENGRWLGAGHVSSDGDWDRVSGFAFAVLSR